MSKDLVAHQAVVVRDEDVKKGENSREQRRPWKAGAAILCVALALFGVVVGTKGRDAVEPVEAEAEDTKPPYSAVMVGTSSVDSNVVAVEGDAWLYESNRLEWWLDQLPANSQGLVKLHAGQSCDDLGQEHWDGVVAPGPWQTLHWSSNEWGESFGDVLLSELSGVYSFAANLERALVMYSETGDILACGTLDPAPENSNFGVTAELHSGFNPHQEGRVAGEVILGKNNVLTWALYNLGAYAAGSVRLFAGSDCNGSNEAVFSTAWQSTEWGIAKGSQVVDRTAQPFYKLVDQAVAVYDQAGELVACDHLVNFAYSIEYEIEEANMELDDILNGLHEDANAYDSTSEYTSAPTTDTPTDSLPDSATAPPTPLATTNTPTIPIVPPTLPPSIQIAPTPAPTEGQAATYVATLKERTEEDQCRDAALGYLETQEKLQNTLVELEAKAEAFGTALAAVQAGTATPEESELNARYEYLKSEEQAHVEAIAVLESTTAKTCEVNRCHFLYELRESFRTKVDEYNVLIEMLSSLANEIQKLPEIYRTQAQNDTIASLNKVISDKLGASRSILDGDQAIGAACQEYEFSNCYGTATAQPGCSKLGCLLQRREVGRVALQLVTTRNTLFEKRSKHTEAIEAIESNTTTPAQVLLYEEFRSLDKAAKNLTSVLEAALRDEPSSCTVAGEVVLGEDMMLRWRTFSEYSADTGYLLFNSGSCDFTIPTYLIVMANDENGENPSTANLNWETIGDSSGRVGSRSLAEENNKPFSMLIRQSVVAYSLTRDVVACGEFTLQPPATVPQLGAKKLTAQIADFPGNDQQCRDAGMQMLDAQMRYETNQEELVSRADEFAAAAEAVLAGVAFPDQFEANSRFGLLTTEQEGLRSLQAELEDTINGPTCRGSRCESYHNSYLDILRVSDERVARLGEVNALIKQLTQGPINSTLSHYDLGELRKEKVGLENARLSTGYRALDARKAISLACGQYRYKNCFQRPPYDKMLDPVCDELTCFRNKASIGKLGAKLAATQETLFTKRTEFAAAIASAQADDQSFAQSELYQEYLSLAATEATTRKLLDEALSKETSTCTIEGSVSLEENLTVRWNLQGYKNEGYVLFHRGESCDDYEPNALIINALDEYGVNGIANLRWSTVANFNETSGFIDASVVSNEPFSRFDISARVVVAYDNNYYPVACGEIIR